MVLSGRLVPKENRSHTQGHPRPDRPREPLGVTFSIRHCVIPRQTPTDRIVKEKQKECAASREKGIELRRQNQDKRRRPNQILGTNSGRKNEKDQPDKRQRSEQSAIACDASASPCQDDDNGDNKKLKQGSGEILCSRKIVRIGPAKFRPTRLTQPIGDPPNAPEASVTENLFEENERETKEGFAP